MALLQALLVVGPGFGPLNVWPGFEVIFPQPTGNKTLWLKPVERSTEPLQRTEKK